MKPPEPDLSRTAGRVLLTQWATVRGNQAGMPLLVRGEGAHVWDSDGRKLLDTLSGCWSVSIGYGRREIARSVYRQLRTLSYAPLDWRAHRPAVELAVRLLALAPPGMERIFFCSGGAEGVEIALQLSRQFMRATGQPRRDIVLYRSNSYHGATLGALSVTGQEFARLSCDGLVSGTSPVCQADCARCPLGLTHPDCALACVDSVEQAILKIGAERVAALIAEPVPAFERVLLAPAGYWPKLKAMLDRYGVLLIFDEVVTGMGRTGRWFAASHWDVAPDLIVLAKGLSGGYAPLGAVLIGEKVASRLQDAVIAGYTFGGHPASCAAALATLDVLQGLLPDVSERGAQLLAGLTRLSSARPFTGAVAGIGLLASMELRLDAASQRELARHLRDEGLLCLVEDSVLPIAPPLCVSGTEIRFLLSALESALVKLERGHSPQPSPLHK